MAFFICQACGTEYDAEDPKCPSCGRTETIRLNRTDRMVDKVIAGRFKIIKKLGQGGMGAVYLAEQVGIGHRVAIKFLKSEFSTDVEIARRFLNEAKTYAKVSHPNAVTFHEFGQDDEGNLFIAMEYCEGDDLKKTIASRGRLPVIEAIEVVTQVADVLADAHQKQIVHRDLKPENIMIRKGLRGMHAKVLDFGIARLMDASTKLTVAGAIAGTPRYMSPEQVEGKEADFRADVYSLGIVCFEALTGRQPFDGNTIAEIMRKQVLEPLPKLADFFSDLDLPDLQRVLEKACAKRREDRFPDMVAFASALNAATPTGLHQALPAVQRVSTEAARQSVSRATPFPGKDGGVAVPGTLVGTDALDKTTVPTSSHSPSSNSTIAAEAMTQQPGVGSISPRGSVGDVSLPPRVPRSNTPMIVLVAVLLVGLVAGGAVLLGGNKDPKVDPDPRKDPEVKIVDATRPVDDPAKAAADAVSKAIHDQSALEKLKSAHTNWEKGDLNAAKVDLENVAADTAVKVEADELLAKVKTVQEALAAGDAQRAKGNCDAALRSYTVATKLNPNVDAVNRGIGACRAAAIPGQVE